MMAQLQQLIDHQNFAQGEFEEYVPSEDSDTPTPRQYPQHPSPHREPIKHLLIGSPKAVTGTIQYLQMIGYANVGDWSQLLPTVNPGEVMSILIRQILVS